MKQLLILLISIFLITACKNPDTAASDKSNAQNEMDPRPELQLDSGYVKREVERSLPTERALAQSKLDRDITEQSVPMQLLTSVVYEIDFIMVVNQESLENTKKDEWLDFNDDFTYSMYKNNKLTQHGKYFYNTKTDILLMLGNSEKDYPSEWTVKSAGDVIVMVGTSTFKNNNTQIHMVGQDRDAWYAGKEIKK